MSSEFNDTCTCCGREHSGLPWHLDPEDADEVDSNWPTTTIRWGVYHKYKDIYHSTPYHKRWEFLPNEVLLCVWVPNATLAIEQLSLLIQSVTGVPGLEYRAATRILNTLTWPHRPENEGLATVATALGYILASNGGCAGTLTLAQPGSGFDFERSLTRTPVYLRFQKDVAETDVDVPRYPDGSRVDARPATLDHGLLRASRRIQAAAADPPVEVELALESHRVGGDLSLGVEIRSETTIDERYCEVHR